MWVPFFASFVHISGDGWWASAEFGPTSQDQQSGDPWSFSLSIRCRSVHTWRTNLQAPSNRNSNLRCIIDHLISYQRFCAVSYLPSDFVTSEDGCQGRALPGGSEWRPWNPLVSIIRKMTLEKSFLHRKSMSRWHQGVAWLRSNDACILSLHGQSHSQSI